MANRRWTKKGEELLNQIRNTSLFENELALWYLGQSGFLIRTAEHTVLIDPVLSDLKDEQGNSRREYEPPFSGEDLVVDTVFCTHAHQDHCNLETLQALYRASPDLIIVVPAGIRRQLLEAGFLPRNVLGINEKEIARKEGMRISSMAAAHPIVEKDENEQDLCLCYYMDFNGIRLLHMGDTYLCERLIKDLQDLEETDVLMTPVNGQDYFRSARGCIGNLSGYESARIAQMINAKLTIPCHYDMVKGNTCRIHEFVENMEEYYPEGCYSIPRLGERIIIRKDEMI